MARDDSHGPRSRRALYEAGLRSNRNTVMYLPCPRSQSHDKTPLTALSPSPASTQSENTQMHSNAGLKYVGQKGG